ncbi:MAG: 3-hydroxybutyryl-CoA dehydrogenase [Deltaproteobacteria bacterium HGW-Deltaproteobacteria-13]|jgi:3-hydroxybutyryl-CoA dehydrogenase|nr:MAG: 3-hydroxybutyryl-CoA dehydrogenase [Deltaproteobacteria bacterium HGW-Deltaproteobacteria-13]
MKVEEIKNVLIVGSGTMGQQIGFQCALNDCNVVLYDIKKEFLEKAMERINRIASRMIREGRITQEKAEATVSRIKTTVDMAEAAKDADLVSESVPEDPELKGKVFGQLNALCPARTIFTTNTSTLLPSMFAQATGRPEKFLAYHFHDIRMTNVVDVMPHPGTSPEVVQLVKEFAERTGLAPIVLHKESTGYVFNYMFTGLFDNALTLASNDVAAVEDIDRVWMGIMRMMIGPFGLMDSVGLDTVWHVSNFWAKNTGDPVKVRNAEFVKKYVDRGELGQKTRKGFYTYPSPSFTSPDFLKGIK